VANAFPVMKLVESVLALYNLIAKIVLMATFWMMIPVCHVIQHAKHAQALFGMSV